VGEPIRRQILRTGIQLDRFRRGRPLFSAFAVLVMCWSSA